MCVKPLFVSALDEADIALLKTYVSTSSIYNSRTNFCLLVYSGRQL